MTDPRPARLLRASVFLKLLIIMLAMAASLLVLVFAFFSFIVNPTLHRSINELVEEHSRLLAGTAPDQQAARDLGRRLNLLIRYEGPARSWSTSRSLPSIDEVRRMWAGGGEDAAASRGRYHLVSAPDGGTYLVSWTFGEQLHQAHHSLILLLLGLMAGVLLVAYVVLRRLLRPLKDLHAGVARLSEGHLDVRLPRNTFDEFGDLTEAFNRMVTRVREMLRARDQLLLDVSHELRSPLTRMKVALELLPASDMTSRMAADVAGMELMITELLELERLREGPGLRIERNDLAALLREVAAGFEGRAPGVVCSGPPELSASFDRERIRIVLRNLLENAVACSPAGSRAVEAECATGAGGIVITVRDDGPGIPQEDLGRLFEPFFRVDRSRSRATGGYGLGLGICRRIVEAHGGRIIVANNPGRGATFRVTLPG